MTAALIYGFVAACLVGIGLFGLVRHVSPFRQLICFNLVGSGVFLLFGVAARRGADAGLDADPVPQAIVITGLVVAFAASALAIALILRIAETDRGASDE